RAADGIPLLVKQTADLADHQYLVTLVVTPVAAPLDRLQRGKLGFPVAQHVRFDVTQLADFANGAVALGRDRREFAITAGITRFRFRRGPRPAPSASGPDGR